MPALATLDDLKALIGTTKSTEDAMLTAMIERASATAERLAGRPLRRETGRIEHPHDAGRPAWRYVLRLGLAPVESVAEAVQVHQPASDAELDAADPLVEGTHYVIDQTIGGLRRIDGRLWLLRPRHIRITYTGGYIDPATLTPPAGAMLPPEDLQEGVLQQALQAFNYKSTGGVGQVSMSGGSAGGARAGGLEPHPLLVAACRGLRRYSV